MGKQFTNIRHGLGSDNSIGIYNYGLKMRPVVWVCITRGEYSPC